MGKRNNHGSGNNSKWSRQNKYLTPEYDPSMERSNEEDANVDVEGKPKISLGMWVRLNLCDSLHGSNYITDYLAIFRVCRILIIVILKGVRERNLCVWE